MYLRLAPPELGVGGSGSWNIPLGLLGADLSTQGTWSGREGEDDSAGKSFMSFEGGNVPQYHDDGYGMKIILTQFLSVIQTSRYHNRTYLNRSQTYRQDIKCSVVMKH